MQERRYDASRGMSLLVEDWVSRASALQRKGRAGIGSHAQTRCKGGTQFSVHLHVEAQCCRGFGTIHRKLC